MCQFPLFTPGQLNGVFANIQNDIFNNGSEKWLVNYDNANGFAEITVETHATREPDTRLLLMPGLLGAAYRLPQK